MAQNIAKVHISTPIELVTAGEALGNSWFRGQGSDQWGLESTLERDARNFGFPLDGLWKREQEMLSLFKTRAHLYIREFVAPRNDFEWFSLIRHYGGPSRLLDVTTSYLVAAYFALSDSQPKRDAAIWAFRDTTIPKDQSFDFNNLFQENSEANLIIGSPERLNVRLNCQSGEFFVPGSVAKSLEDQIGTKFNTEFKKKPSIYKPVCHMKTEHHRIWKFIIPRSAHSEIFRFISSCNVRGYSLFPGIDGLAASLRELMRAFD